MFSVVKKYLLSISRFKKSLLLILVLAVLVIIVFFFTTMQHAPLPGSANRAVYIEKTGNHYRFIKDGKPFLIKGGAGDTNLKELAAAGGNTISCWDTSKIAYTLSEAAKYQLSVIIGLDIPGGDNENFYKSDSNIAAAYQSCKALVNRYKNNKQLLAWCLGNELSMPLKLIKPPFYPAYNKILDMIHQVDTNHPVATSVMNIPKRAMINMQWRIPGLDFICVNTYNRLKAIESDLSLVKSFWDGPYLIGEWAPNGGWEAALTSWEAPIENTSTKKAEQFYELFHSYMPVKDPRFLGSLVYYWGVRQEYTHTWYSVFDEHNQPGEVYEAIADCWNNATTKHLSPRVDYMLVDSLGAADNIIMSAGTLHKAVISLPPSEPADSLSYHWEILKEDWQTWGKTWSNFRKPVPEMNVLLADNQQQINFVTPKTEGPYRLYVTVSNAKGYCATANTPIYITQ